jgi:phospholipase C
MKSYFLPRMAALSRLLVLGLLVASCAGDQVALKKINHILVVIEENHSFDNLFGLFPGANGIFNAGSKVIQVDENGKPYESLPPVWDARYKTTDTRFPPKLANAPFLMNPYVAEDGFTADPVHKFVEQQEQINNGAINRFAGVSNVKAMAMGYYDISSSVLWKLAREYALADNAFHSAFGGSFLNHQYLICSCTYRWADAPAEVAEKLKAKRTMTDDGYVVNTIEAQNFHRQPPLPGDAPIYLPPQSGIATIGDRLDALGSDKVHWKWYSGGFADALAGRPDKDFQFHHQPFMYLAKYAPNSQEQLAHLKDEADLYADIAKGELPELAIYKPLGRYNWHPEYANLSDGDRHLGDLIERLKASKLWSDTLIIITFDENGGFWDHVSPPKRDRFGPGVRVPLIAVGSMVKRGFVDHTEYDFGSILRTVEMRFGVPSVVPEVDGKATPLTALIKRGP